ncbi:MAG: ABC transporter substrate-binding protein [Sphingomonas sp.]|nr:ABC transporter substrate-binding protein [Sphingomonas sp.]
MIRAAALAALLALGGCGASAPPPALREGRPLRIVSVNPCIDAVLMRVADPGQIAAISAYSHDPRATSIPLAQARRFAAIDGSAEAIVALRPDLVLASGSLTPATSAALARLGIRKVELGLPQSIVDSEAQVRDIARAVGHPERGEALAAEMAAAVVAARAPGAPVPALIWEGGGLVPALGTLPDEMLRTAGFANQAATYGLRNWDQLPLERLVARPPQVLLTPPGAARDDRLLGHPVLRRLRTRIAVRDFPERLLFCGGPTIIDALARLRTVRASL